MRGLLQCPCCMATFDKRMIKKKAEGCPDIHCVGYGEMHLVEVDVLLEPIIRKLREKGWYLKFHKVISRSGRLGKDKKTTLEFFSDAGIPNDSAPDDFIWKENVLTSIYPEDDELNNIKKLSEWVKGVHKNDEDDPTEFPEDYYEWYSIKTHDNPFGNSIHGNEPVGAEEIISIVADYYNLSSHDVKSRKRQEKMVKARQVSAYILKEFCNMDMTDIAKALDYRDSTSIIYSLCKCKELSKLDGEFAKEIDDIKKKVRG